VLTFNSLSSRTIRLMQSSNSTGRLSMRH
jgi:hypothetical protein